MISAMNYLAEGRCSKRRLYTKLEEEFSNESNLKDKIEETLLYLTQLNLINDERIAKRVAQQYRHKGDNFIIQHLKQLGISKFYINTALASIETEYQRALEAISFLPNGDEKELQNQIMRLLCSRSFSYETLHQVISTIFRPYKLQIAQNCHL